jgi:single-strand DNA-binding protein
MLPDFDRGGCMNNLNSILIEGNLVKDPMLRSTPKGTQVCTLRLASNRYCKHETGFEREVSFFDVETWARLAETCYAKGKKGRGVRVVGRLKQDRWNSSDGKLQSRISIVAEHVEFRPEFRKDAKPAAEDAAASKISYDDYLENETDEHILAMAEKEFAPVVF